MDAAARTRLWWTSAAGVALAAGIAATANLAGRYLYLRLDLSRGRAYSVSAATKRLVRALPDPVVVDVYASKDLPPQIAVNREYLRDLLAEYRSGSRGKVKVRWHEIGEEPEDREKALRAGVQPVRFDIVSNERFEQREGCLGLSLQYQDKKDAIAYLQETAGLEYDLTSRIKNLSTPKKPELAFLKDNGAVEPASLGKPLVRRLEERFLVRTLELSSLPDDGIPPEIRTVLWLGPQGKASDRALFLLDQYLLSGGSLGLGLDSRRVDLRNFLATPNDTGLEGLLAPRGLRPRAEIVADAQSQPIQIAVQQGPFQMMNVVQYPPFVVATNLNEENPMTKTLGSLVLPFVSPIGVSTAAGGRVEVLVRSSARSWLQAVGISGAVDLNPFQLKAPGPDAEPGPFILGAVVEGEYPPAFPAAPKGFKGKAPLTKALRPARLAVIGTSRFVSPELRAPTNNLLFLLNLADWLAMDAELIAIRSKGVSFRPLAEIAPAGKTAIRWLLILGPPLAAVGAGLFAWELRRRRRALSLALYGQPAAADAPTAHEPPAQAPPQTPAEPAVEA